MLDRRVAVSCSTKNTAVLERHAGIRDGLRRDNDAVVNILFAAQSCEPADELFPLQ